MDNIIEDCMRAVVGHGNVLIRKAHDHIKSDKIISKFICDLADRDEIKVHNTVTMQGMQRYIDSYELDSDILSIRDAQDMLPAAIKKLESEMEHKNIRLIVSEEDDTRQTTLERRKRCVDLYAHLYHKFDYVLDLTLYSDLDVAKAVDKIDPAAFWKQRDIAVNFGKGVLRNTPWYYASEVPVAYIRKGLIAESASEAVEGIFKSLDQGIISFNYLRQILHRSLANAFLNGHELIEQEDILL